MLNKFGAWLRGLWNGWNEFFFAPKPALQMGVFRFLFAVNAFLMYAVRIKDWRFYFTDDGFLPLAGVYDILPEFYRPAVSWYPTTASMALAMNIGLLVALAFLIVGVLPRLAALVGFLLHIALIQRNYSIAYGADFINTFMFFALIFMRSDRRFSLTSWWRSRRGLRAVEPVGSIQQLLSSAFYRVMQLQLCLIYAYTGLEKMKGAPWWDGSAIWAVVGNTQIMFVDLSIIGKFPLLLAAATFMTLFFEIYFAIIVWTPMRKWIILLGCMMHIGIALSIGLFYFSIGMMSVYILFAKTEWLERVLTKMRLSPAWIGYEPTEA